MVLQDCDLSDCKAAVSEILSEPARQYPPKPGDVLEAAQRLKRNATKLIPSSGDFRGPAIEEYTQELPIAGKKTNMHYLRASDEARAAYRANAEAQGRRYSEISQNAGTAWDNDCKIPAAQMHHLFEQLYQLMDDYGAAKGDPDAIAKIDRRRDALKQFYYDVAREA
jgi:hypothetical protein